MRTTRQLSITLPVEMADMVKEKVASGDYASESEVIRDGLRALEERSRAVERWLRNEVVEAYDEYVAEPSSGSGLRRG
jgi:antitoxin ParD1/3/4